MVFQTDNRLYLSFQTDSRLYLLHAFKGPFIRFNDKPAWKYLELLGFSILFDRAKLVVIKIYLATLNKDIPIPKISIFIVDYILSVREYLAKTGMKDRENQNL